MLTEEQKRMVAVDTLRRYFGSTLSSVVIVDAAGVVRYFHRAIAGLTYRPVSELVEELKKLTL